MRNYKTRKPKIGDIFFGEKEFIIGRKKFDNENIIEVSITIEQTIVETQKKENMISKGMIFSFDKKYKKNMAVIDELRKDAIFVVENIQFENELTLLHSILPESYLITARKLKNSKFDPEGEVIEFYTYTNQYENVYNRQLEIIGNLENLKK
jgi:hypothetical protein